MFFREPSHLEASRVLVIKAQAAHALATMVLETMKVIGDLPKASSRRVTSQVFRVILSS